MAGYRLAWNLDQRGKKMSIASHRAFFSNVRINAYLQPLVRIHAKRRTADLLGFQLSTETASSARHSIPPQQRSHYARLYECPEGKHSLEQPSSTLRRQRPRITYRLVRARVRIWHMNIKVAHVDDNRFPKSHICGLIPPIREPVHVHVHHTF
jgi:hypothetical protein